MAPRKRKGEGEDEASKPVPAPSTRVTRSSARLSNSPFTVPPPEMPKKKKGKAAAKVEKAKPQEKEETETKAVTEMENENENVEEKENDKEQAETEDAATEDGVKMTIVIEHCKQCNSFKTRATQVKSGLEDGVPGITVLLNPDKPRRGCFEIRKEGGETFISLLDMKRPFTPMKELDMDKVISDIIDKIK